MNPVIPCSIGNVSIIPGFTYPIRKNNSLTRLGLSRSNVKPGSSTSRFLLPSFVASGVFMQNKIIYSFHKKSRTSISATETDVAVEEQGPPVTDEDSGEIPSNEVSSSKSDANPEPANVKRSRPARKSDMPPVKNEDLIPGATFTGKVKSVQPFGAFVDFGAFTDGLVHISMLSDSYVKDVASVVSVGQEVKVKLIEVNTETQRISLSMRENADTGGKPRKDPAITTEKPGSRKRNTSKSGPKKDNVTKSSKFVIGQELVGSVKNMIRNGAFISLPEGEEGFLPVSEEPDDGFENVMGNTSLEVGQEVNVRVLRINRGQVTLTMKKEEDAADLGSTFNHGVIHAATNPFVVAFRKNKDIASFLDVREKTQTEVPKPSTAGTPEEIKGTVTQEETILGVPDVQGEPENSEKLTDDVPSALKQNAKEEISENEVDVGTSAINGSSTAVVNDESNLVSEVSIPTPGVDSATEKETEVASGSLTPEEDLPTVNPIIEEATQTDVTTSDLKTDTPVEIANENVIGSGVDQVAEDEKQSQTPITSEEFAAAALTDTDVVEPIPDKNDTITESDITSNAPAPQETTDDDVGTSAINGSSTAVVDDESNLVSDVSSPTPGVDSAIEKETELASGSLTPEEDLPTVNPIIEEATQTDVTTSDLETDSPIEIANENVIGSGVDQGAEDEKQSQTPITSEEFAAAALTDTDVVEPIPDKNNTITESDITSNAPAPQETTDDDVGTGAINGSSTAVVDDESNLVGNVSSPTPGVDSAIEKETEVASGSLTPEEDLSTVNPIIEEATQTDVTRSDLKTDSPVEIANENVIGSGVDQVTEDEKQSQTPNTSEEFAAAALTDSDVVEPSPVENDIITESDITSNAPAPQETTDDDVGAIRENNDSLSGQSGELSPEGSLSTDATEETDQVPSPEGSATEEIKPSIDDPEEVQTQTPATENETSITSQGEDNEVAIASEKNSSSSNSDGQAGITSGEGLTKATISPALVKQLREETGAGMMDCKKALAETGGDIVKAQEYLRKKGLSSAEKKASRVTAEGRIGSYIHDSRIGVLVEVNCETDFVSRGEIFKELVDDIAMQVAACPQVEYLVTEDVPEEIVNKEKEIELQKEDLASKPEQIRSKIVEGRIRKRLEELALLEQPYIKNDKLAVKDLVKQTIATIGENIKVKRFVRFNLGEGLEKKSQDFAAEVAAQTAAKPAPTPAKEQPAVAEANETEPKKSTVAVSASLVKQLREETGAGMMDCKKALAETGGDLEKAQEYLRKKGLSSADKKSSRLAAEGRIGAYIHDSRIGVLIEVNCETDFVGRGEKFKELVDDLAMQVVACPQVQFVSIEDIPEAVVKKEKELELQREDLLSKPENIRERIVEGRVSKRLGELVLLEQPFIKDDSVLVKDLVKQTVAALGENIKVRRFVRFTLGETTEKETTVPA